MRKISQTALMALALGCTSPAFADDQDSGVAAGSDVAATNVASGNTATIVVIGVGTAAILGAVIAGSSGKSASSTTSTTTSK
jgi:hypothetical protein